MFVYILVVIIVLFAIFKERQALGCPSIPDGSDCDNKNGKAVKGTHPLPTDSNFQIFDKIKKAASFMNRWVVWRIAILVALFSVIVMYFFIYQRFPSEKELTIGMFVITATVYFMFNFYKFHLSQYAENNVDDGVNILVARSA